VLPGSSLATSTPPTRPSSAPLAPNGCSPP
jgi:hypothetical protein